MNSGFIKYGLKISSILILSGFLYSNLSVYKLFTNDCSFEENSCCCSHDNNSGVTNFSKACCCEIKEIPENQTEATLITSDLQNKNVNSDFKFIIKSAVHLNRAVSVLLKYSNHNPQGREILIINSILRI